jgi:hypothetical protein
MCAVDGKHVRIKMPSGSGVLFNNYKHFFSVLLLALADADYCFIALVIVANAKSSQRLQYFKNSNTERKRVESTGNPRQHAVA